MDSNITYEKIRKYINATRMDKTVSRFKLNYSELCFFYELVQKNPFDTMAILFQYGKAKGYRAAKATFHAKKDIK
mgnify:CR=1 FL=1